MDELLRDFLTETAEHLEGVETQLVLFERNPRDASLVASIFRLVHTIKGTSSFLGLHRLQRVAHSAETLIGELRDGAPPTQRKVSLILAAIDRIKSIVADIDQLGAEPDADDSELIEALEANVGISEGDDVPVEAAPPADTAPVEVSVEVHAPTADQAAAIAAAATTAAAAATAAATAPAPTPAPAPRSAAPASPPAARNAPAPAAGGPKASAAPAGGGGGALEGGGGAAKGAETIRVAVDTIERIMQLVSELVLNRNQLLELTRHRENDTVKAPLQRLSGLTTDLQDAVMRARMQPVGRLFSGLPRLVRELSAECGKKIDLITDGADTELDRQLIEVLRDPLTHLIRNCADHGIETPEERVAAGKPEFGEIRVAASHEAGQITIDISDDGRGLNMERIRAKAIASGMATEQSLSTMSDEEIMRFIFEPGFSTAAKVTGVSGRGVGMDVVRSNIESIGGSVSLASAEGRGSRFSLRIPLTLAIAPALIVKVGDQRFALPQSAVVEAVGLGSDSRHTIDQVQNALVLKLREEVVPVLDLNTILGLDGTEEDHEDQLVVILRVGGGTLGVRVDAVLDVQEIVVKPLNPSLAHLKIFTGQTILGDGSVVLILDPSGIAQELGLASGEKKREAAKESFSKEERTRLVLFRAGYGLPKVLPLSLLARIEMVDASRIERSGDKFLMLHQGRLMPLLPLAPMHEITAKAHPVLVITAQDRTIGLLVDEIIDILEEKLEVQLTSESGDIVGSAEVRGEPVELIDVTYFMQQAFSNLSVQEPKQLLYAEGDPFFRDTLLPVLKSQGYAITATLSAEEVVSLLDSGNQFDAVMIDAEMTDKSGAPLAAFLRDRVLSDEMPLLLLHELPTAAVMGLPTGHHMTANVSKLDRQYLLNTLASLLTLNERNDGGYMSREMAA
jgi:two-component system, chemotaxis family, sensor kinase CheA